jgi:hypothetical protein
MSWRQNKTAEKKKAFAKGSGNSESIPLKKLEKVARQGYFGIWKWVFDISWV